MSDIDKEMSQAVERAIFKTNDPEKIRGMFSQAFVAWSQERSTLGGYLRDIRLLRGWCTETCAEKAGVSKGLWQSWEADRETPTEQEFGALISGMGFGPEKRADLRRLLSDSPRQRLLMLSRLRPEFLAARGVAKLEASGEWQKLPEPLQRALLVWGQERGLSSAEELLEFFSSLEDDEARFEWAEEVLKCRD